jgi:hypothetical protein
LNPQTRTSFVGHEKNLFIYPIRPEQAAPDGELMQT